MLEIAGLLVVAVICFGLYFTFRQTAVRNVSRYKDHAPLNTSTLERVTVTLAQFGFSDEPSNAELSTIRVKGGARKWEFCAAGYSHESQSGPAARWRLIIRLKDGDYLRFIRQPENPRDPNATLIVPASGEIQGVDVGYVPREQAATIAPLLDAGALFFVKVQRIAAENQVNSFPKMYVYARLVRRPESGRSETA